MNGGRTEIDYDNVFKMMCADNEDSQAFFCSFSVFKSIVALERRRIDRSKETSCLAVISLGSDRAFAEDCRRLERILQEQLRTGDPISRLEEGSYILMLSGVDEEGTWPVLGRIDSAFHRTCAHSGAKLTYSLAALTPGDSKRNEEKQSSFPEEDAGGLTEG